MRRDRMIFMEPLDVAQHVIVCRLSKKSLQSGQTAAFVHDIGSMSSMGRHMGCHSLKKRS